MAGGPDGTLVDCCMRGRSHVGLGRFDTFRLLADIQQSSCVAHIAEVGEWLCCLLWVGYDGYMLWWLCSAHLWSMLSNLHD